jgi:diguanylate cyclase (GGDEF)-like protein/PAS domain S-box-containing protein
VKLSLRYKAALFIAATQLALLGLLLVTNLVQTRNYLEEDLALHANSMAEVVATSATEPLLSMDLAQLKNLVDGVVMKYRIAHVRIVDHRGQELAAAGQPGDQAQRVHVERPILVAGSLFGTVRVEVSRAETAAAIAHNTRNNVSIALLEVGLVALISLTLGWFLTRNLATLARAAQAIGRGDYTARAPITAADEVGELATRFNAMAEQLQNHVSELAGSQRRFRELADDTSDWIWETDADGRYTYVSNRAEEIVGYTPDQLVGNSAFDYMGTEDAERLGKLFAGVRAEQRAFYGFEHAAVRADGSVVQLEANGRPILDAAGNVIGYRGVTRDVSRRKDDEARLVYLAEHDPLTGLFSRHRFLELLDDEVRLAAARGSSLAVLFVDLDDFKLINDTHGHVAGDALLRLVSEALRGAAGASTPIARIGGDEFGVLLLDQADAAVAARVLDEIVHAFAAPIDVEGRPIAVSVSVGACVAPAGGADAHTLVRWADRAMYGAKRAGGSGYRLSAKAPEAAAYGYECALPAAWEARL